jgi:hypothetical protein
MSNQATTKEPRRVFIGAHIPAEMRDVLADIASQHDEPFSATVRRMLRAGVAHFSAATGGIKVPIHCAKSGSRTGKAVKKGRNQ